MTTSPGLSIRLLLSGHNFSQASQVLHTAALENAGRLVVSLDTYKTVLVPAYLCEPGTEVDYLCFNGMDVSEDEVVVVSAKHDDIVAVMAVRTDIVGLVANQWSGEVEYTSPLLEIASGAKKRDVNVFLTTDNAYIAVWDKGLRFAEALPDPSADSVLYYLQVLGRELRLKKFDINIGGHGAPDVVAAVEPYFKNVKQA